MGANTISPTAEATTRLEGFAILRLTFDKPVKAKPHKTAVANAEKYNCPDLSGNNPRIGIHPNIPSYNGVGNWPRTIDIIDAEAQRQNNDLKRLVCNPTNID